jgi:hypothetical protein
MSLHHPVTVDFDSVVDLVIISIDEWRGEKFVIAKYRYGDGVLLFRAIDTAEGHTRLADFRGYEHTTSFGPADIICKEEP